MRVRKAAIGTSALVAIATVVCACSPADDAESRDPTVFIHSTQFAPPPAPITDIAPTAEQLTALYNATTNYSIRQEDRALLLDGPSDLTLPIARAWGAQLTQYIQFTAVEPVGPETINATGQGHVEGMEPYPVGPIPFVRYNNEWKLSRAFVCGRLFFAAPQVCG